MIRNGMIMAPYLLWFMDWDHLYNANSYHAALGVTFFCGFHFVRIARNMSRGLSTLEFKRDYYDSTYYLGFDKTWEVSYGRKGYFFSWLFTSWYGERENIDYVMKHYFKYEAEDEINID
jgi:hypothetical protein